METTIGQLLVNEALPPEYRDYNRVLDKRSTKQLFDRIAKERPEEYRDIAGKLADIGRKVSWSEGGFSTAVSHLQDSPRAAKLKLQLQQELDHIYRTEKDPKRLQEKVVATAGKYQAKMADVVLEDSLKENNPLADMSVGAGRGNKFHINSLRGADIFYTDHFGRLMPVPVLHNYSEGLRPVEYLAASFGARKGVIDTKTATRDAGFLSKQLVQMSHRLLVTDIDAPEPPKRPRGMPVSTSDVDSVGALLAHDVGPYKRNTLITGKVLKRLRDMGIEEILVRSPTVGGPPDGGVYSRDVGVRERGVLAPRGDFVGIAAAHAIAEPVTQSQLSSKHSAGRAGAEAGTVTGFQLINQLLTVPKAFRGGAVHAQADGRVTNIKKAPQGGYYIFIGDSQHYVAPGQEIKVKLGQRVEAGDVLTDGIPNPAQVVQHKGIGEGRRYFVELFRDTLAGLGLSADRRNIELLARGAINHVQLADNVGEWVEGSIVPYHIIESAWKPRPGSEELPIGNAEGMYLEEPVLHYTVGTKLRPSVIEKLRKFGVTKVVAHPEPPPFQPVMVPSNLNVTYDPDWLARTLGGYQKRTLLKAVHEGDVSDEAGTSYVPGLARVVDFSRIGKTRGWTQQDLEAARHATEEAFVE